MGHCFTSCMIWRSEHRSTTHAKRSLIICPAATGVSFPKVRDYSVYLYCIVLYCMFVWCDGVSVDRLCDPVWTQLPNGWLLSCCCCCWCCCPPEVVQSPEGICGLEEDWEDCLSLCHSTPNDIWRSVSSIIPFYYQTLTNKPTNDLWTLAASLSVSLCLLICLSIYFSVFFLHFCHR